LAKLCGVWFWLGHVGRFKNKHRALGNGNHDSCSCAVFKVVAQRTRCALLALLVRLLCAAFVSFLVFRVAQPYSFAGSQSGGGLFSLKFDARWQNSMQQIQGQVSGNADFPPNHQWANRPAIIFPLENMVKWGLGWGLGISVCLGLILAGLDSLVALAFRRQQRWQRHLVLLTWVGFYFAWQGTQWVKPIRYFLPLYPSLGGFWGLALGNTDLLGASITTSRTISA
jgi:hypothetical protein